MEMGDLLFRTLGVMKCREKKSSQSADGLMYNTSLAYAREVQIWETERMLEDCKDLWKNVNSYPNLSLVIPLGNRIIKHINDANLLSIYSTT